MEETRQGPALTRRPLFLRPASLSAWLISAGISCVRSTCARSTCGRLSCRRPSVRLHAFVQPLVNSPSFGVKLLSTDPPVDRRDSGRRRSDRPPLREPGRARAAAYRRHQPAARTMVKMSKASAPRAQTRAATGWAVSGAASSDRRWTAYVAIRERRGGTAIARRSMLRAATSGCPAAEDCRDAGCRYRLTRSPRTSPCR